MKGKWGLRVCWDLFCLLFCVSYTSSTIRVSVPKLRIQESISVTDLQPHGQHNLELSSELSARNADTASLIRIRRTQNNSNIDNATVSNFSKTTEIPFRGWPTLRWIGNPPNQVSHAGPLKLNHSLRTELYTSVLYFLHSLQRLIILFTKMNTSGHLIESSLFRYCKNSVNSGL